MGSETIKLPVIDFSNLKQDIPAWESIKNLVRSALETCGCFEATFDQIPTDIRKSVIDGMIQLFDLPLQNKLRNTSNKPYHGYVGPYALAPHFESLGIEDPISHEKVESFTNLLWSKPNPTFSKSMQSFSEKLSELDQTVRRIVLESLGLQKYMFEHMESTDYRVRVQKYGGPQTDDPKLGLPSHTDKTIVSILYQNEVNGLEVLTKDGQWITVQPSMNSFIVMIGDAFHAWTNGRLHSAHHRVMMTGNVARYSIGLFSVPKRGYIIKAPEEMVNEEHPLLFKPFDNVEFLTFFYTEAGQKSPDALKAYCGA